MKETMSILDAFKADCQENEIGQNCGGDLQAEVEKQLKAMADYDANPEKLDAKIEFNPEEFDFNEKKISQQLYIEEDYKYPEADNPEELLRMTLGEDTVNETYAPINSNMAPDVECNEVKVGDKLKIYHHTGFINGECEVSKIMKVYDPFTFEPVVAVMVKYEWENIKGEKFNGEMKLTDPEDSSNQFVYFNLDTKEVIKQFTFKDENKGK